jgi:hypothetical protein
MNYSKFCDSEIKVDPDSTTSHLPRSGGNQQWVGGMHQQGHQTSEQQSMMYQMLPPNSNYTRNQSAHWGQPKETQVQGYSGDSVFRVPRGRPPSRPSNPATPQSPSEAPSKQFKLQENHLRSPRYGVTEQSQIKREILTPPYNPGFQHNTSWKQSPVQRSPHQSPDINRNVYDANVQENKTEMDYVPYQHQGNVNQFDHLPVPRYHDRYSEIASKLYNNDNAVPPSSMQYNSYSMEPNKSNYLQGSPYVAYAHNLPLESSQGFVHSGYGNSGFSSPQSPLPVRSPNIANPNFYEQSQMNEQPQGNTNQGNINNYNKNCMDVENDNPNFMEAMGTENTWRKNYSTSEKVVSPYSIQYKSPHSYQNQSGSLTQHPEGAGNSMSNEKMIIPPRIKQEPGCYPQEQCSAQIRNDHSYSREQWKPNFSPNNVQLHQPIKVENNHRYFSETDYKTCDFPSTVYSSNTYPYPGAVYPGRNNISENRFYHDSNSSQTIPAENPGKMREFQNRYQVKRFFLLSLFF